MSYQVELTARAERDVDTILAWLAHHSPQGAAMWYRRWNEVLEDLATSADDCSLAPENEEHEEEIRHVMFKTRRGKIYRALFIIRENQIFVIHVRGPGQDLMAADDIQLP